MPHSDITPSELDHGMERLVQWQSPFTLTPRKPSIDDFSNNIRAWQNQTFQGDLSDGSETLFSMYLERAIEEDKKMVGKWERDAKGMPVFVGLPTTSHTSAYNLEI